MAFACLVWSTVGQLVLLLGLQAAGDFLLSHAVGGLLLFVLLARAVVARCWTVPMARASWLALAATW